MNIEQRKVEIRHQRKIKDVYLDNFKIDPLDEIEIEIEIDEKAIEILATELQNFICQSKEEE